MRLHEWDEGASCEPTSRSEIWGIRLVGFDVDVGHPSKVRYSVTTWRPGMSWKCFTLRVATP
jgi:hypothetical protein